MLATPSSGLYHYVRLDPPWFCFGFTSVLFSFRSHLIFHPCLSMIAPVFGVQVLADKHISLSVRIIFSFCRLEIKWGSRKLFLCRWMILDNLVVLILTLFFTRKNLAYRNVEDQILTLQKRGLLNKTQISIENFIMTAWFLAGQTKLTMFRILF